MSHLKIIWEVFKNSSMKDKDMQKAFKRAVTTNACIEILEENEKLNNRKKWISVDVVYPYFDKAVLITDGINIAHARRRRGLMEHFWQIVSSNYREPQRNVTHWMELPELPEKENK
mgnify:CR=1 FL=1